MVSNDRLNLKLWGERNWKNSKEQTNLAESSKEGLWPEEGCFSNDDDDDDDGGGGGDDDDGLSNKLDKAQMIPSRLV
jgi:hypothetical protein